MEPARGESCPSCQRRCPAARGEDKVLSPDQKSFHISKTNSNNLRMKTGIRRVDTAPHGMETPTTLAGCWLAGAHGTSERRGFCHSGQGRGCAAHGEVEVPSPDQKFFHISTIPTNQGTKTVIPRVDTAPHGVETPTQGTPLLIGVREASGPHPMGVSSASSLTVIKYCTATCFKSWSSCT